MRDDSIADYQVELDDGRIINKYVYGRLADGFKYFAPPLDLPTGLTRANIRFVRVMFSCCAPGPYPRPLDADKFWQGDQWEVHITVAAGVRPSGGGMTAFTDILADSGRWFKFQHPGWWESGPMAAQRLPASITGAMNNRFVLTICTGDDDLRTDPRAQPNSEVEVFANLTNPSGGPPVPVKLDTGRLVHRDFVVRVGFLRMRRRETVPGSARSRIGAALGQAPMRMA